MNRIGNSLKRIHILGAAGSGKTTLARQVAQRLNCPWYELDTIAYDGGYGRKRTLEERVDSLQEITDAPAWITEGFFLWWIDDLLEAADAIVWLDLPITVTVPRLITRHFKLSWAGHNRHPGLLKLVRFTWGCLPFYLESNPRIPISLDDDAAVNRATIIQYLKPYEERVIQCRTPKNVDIFLDKLPNTDQND